MVITVMVPAQKLESVNKLKKAYSSMSQAVIRISAQTGASAGDFSFMLDDDFFDYFTQNVNVLKICKTSANGCFTSSYLKSLKGSNWSTYNRKNSLITNDGIAFGWDVSYCSGKGLSEEDEANCIGRFIIDLNGEKAPNRFGYDVFFFAVVDGKGVVPAGSGNNSADCQKNNNGITCAAKVLKEDDITYW